MDFAILHYQQGLEDLAGGRFEINGQKFMHCEAGGGGFKLTPQQLQNAWTGLETSGAFMRKRIESLDGVGTRMQELAAKMMDMCRHKTASGSTGVNPGSNFYGCLDHFYNTCDQAAMAIEETTVASRM